MWAALLKGTSRFGPPNSIRLADFVNLCVARAIIYSPTLNGLGGFAGVIAFCLRIRLPCLRLARFNVMAEDPGRADWKKDFFVGMPAPAGGCRFLPVYLLISSALPMSLHWPPGLLLKCSPSLF